VASKSKTPKGAVFLIMTAASKKKYLAKSEAQITTSAPASSIGMAFRTKSMSRVGQARAAAQVFQNRQLLATTAQSNVESPCCGFRFRLWANLLQPAGIAAIHGAKLGTPVATLPFIAPFVRVVQRADRGAQSSRSWRE
jgi:hypothetical protein